MEINHWLFIMFIKNRLFLVAGLNYFGRKQAIETIKSKMLPAAQTAFSFLVLESKNLALKSLQEQLLTFSFEEQKLVLLQNVDLLSKEAKSYLASNIDKILKVNILIGEVERDFGELQKDKKIASDDLFKLFLTQATLYRVASEKQVSLNDFKFSFRNRNQEETFFCLEKLFEGKDNDRTQGAFVLGVLVNECSYIKKQDIKQISLNYLWDADRLLKEEGRNPRFVLERFLTQFFALG